MLCVSSPIPWCYYASLLAFGIASGLVTPDDNLARLQKFDFVPAQQETLKFVSNNVPSTLEGASVSACGNDRPNIPKSQVTGDLALAKTADCAQKKSQRINSDYPVERGNVAFGSASFDAYSIAAPLKPATKRTKGIITIFLRKPEGKKFVLYQLVGDDGLPLPLSSFDGSGNFASTGIEARPGVYFVAPADQTLPPTNRLLAQRDWSNGCDENRPLSSIGNLRLAFDSCDKRLRKLGTVPVDDSWNNGALYEKGHIRLDDGTQLEAYRVHPGSRNNELDFFYKSDADMDLVVYRLQGSDMVAWPALKLTANIWTKVGYNEEKNRLTTKLPTPTVFVFAPASQHVNRFPRVSATVDGARVEATSNFGLSVRSFAVDGQPWRPENRDIGPGRAMFLYGYRKNFFPVSRSVGQEGVIWQDQTSLTIWMTWFQEDLTSAETTKLLDTDLRLYAAASNKKDAIIAFIAPKGKKDMKKPVHFIKFDSRSGKTLLKTDPPTQHRPASRTEGTLNLAYMYQQADMIWDVDTDVVAMHYCTYGHGGHEQGKVVTVNPSTLTLFPMVRKQRKNPFSTASHSYATPIVKARGSGFYGLDVQDARGARGIKIYYFNDTHKMARQIVTVKFKIAPAVGGTKVWAEAGTPGIVETDDGILVFFATEREPLDPCPGDCQVENRQRDVGFIKIPKDLKDPRVLSDGPLFVSDVFNVNGRKQFNEGLVWLTENKDIDHSSGRLKVTRLASGNIFLSWERWSREKGYQDSQYMVVDQNGAKVHEVTTMQWPLRLGDTDYAILAGDRVVMYTGETKNYRNALLRYEVCISNCKPLDSETNLLLKTKPALQGKRSLRGFSVKSHSLMQITSKTCKKRSFIPELEEEEEEEDEFAA